MALSKIETGNKRPVFSNTPQYSPAVSIRLNATCPEIENEAIFSP